MAGKKKFRRAVRRYIRGRRVLSGLRGFNRRGRLGRLDTHRYVQSFDGAATNLASRTITQAVGVQNFGFEFRLSNLPQYSTLGALYDRYRIDKIQLKFTPMANIVSILGGANPGMVATVLDFDNGAVPLSTLNDYEQYSNCFITPVVRGKTIVRTWKPCVNYSLQDAGGGVSSVGSKRSPWIDCSDVSVVHNGLKFYIDPYAVAGSAQVYQVTGKMWVTFKNVR